jgi:hypothetical protein
MPQQWLSTLKKTRPQIAEVLYDMCCERVSRTINQPPQHIADALNGLVTDDIAVHLFWSCIACRKEDYERRHGRGPNPT